MPTQDFLTVFTVSSSIDAETNSNVKCIGCLFLIGVVLRFRKPETHTKRAAAAQHSTDQGGRGARLSYDSVLAK